MSRMSVSGWLSVQSAHEVCVTGTRSSLTPLLGPSMACPRNWLQRLRVWWSYMTRTFMISLPETPKVWTAPSISRAYTMPEKQSGHQVTATGWPPTTSLTISCRLRTEIG